MTKSKTKESAVILTSNNREVAFLIGEIFSYNNSLKLYHWHITGKKSYSQHMSIDQAINNLLDITDRIVETSYALMETLDISIPKTNIRNDIIESSNQMYKIIDNKRKLFSESFSQALLDEYQEEIQQLLYRLKRLE